MNHESTPMNTNFPNNKKQKVIMKKKLIIGAAFAVLGVLGAQSAVLAQNTISATIAVTIGTGNSVNPPVERASFLQTFNTTNSAANTFTVGGGTNFTLNTGANSVTPGLFLIAPAPGFPCTNCTGVVNAFYGFNTNTISYVIRTNGAALVDLGGTSPSVTFSNTGTGGMVLQPYINAN